MDDPRYEWKKEPCGLCGGSGRLPMKHPRGFYTITQARRRRPSCGECLGRGYIEKRRKRLDVGFDGAGLV